MKNNLFNIAFNNANEKGKIYLNMWISKNEITAVYSTLENWFYISVLQNRNEYKINSMPDMQLYFYAISQKSDCGSSTFGDERHFKNEVKKESIISVIN